MSTNLHVYAKFQLKSGRSKTEYYKRLWQTSSEDTARILAAPDTRKAYGEWCAEQFQEKPEHQATAWARANPMRCQAEHALLVSHLEDLDKWIAEWQAEDASIVWEGW